MKPSVSDEEYPPDHASMCACGGQSAVIDSRVEQRGIRRRRRCFNCPIRWTTYERRPDDTMIQVPQLQADVARDLEKLAEIRAFHAEAIQRIDEILNRIGLV